MRTLSEEDIKRIHITPAIYKSGWIDSQIFNEYSHKNGQVLVRKDVNNKDVVKRASFKKSDYALFRKDSNIPLAIVEAKDMSKSIGSGMQQAIEYALDIQAPFAYSSNGKGFLEHDFLTGLETERSIDDFPTESELWDRYLKAKNISKEQERIIDNPLHFDDFSRKIPRYYQELAIRNTVVAIAKGQKRILLVMATGTGKTFTAFQIIWKLYESKKVRKVLYLADRNILIDQTMQQDFKPFEKVMTKVKGKNPDSAYEIYMSLYHQLAGDEGEEPFKEFEPSFFDLIVVDEAHRGSAREESKWRRILEYFDSAIQIGMTATPKETKYISNINYFGDPIYTYTLKQGIHDGFLAPYKVVRVNLDRDVEGWRPYKGQLDEYGELIEDREYGRSDYDRKLIIDERTKAVAKRITQWLRENGRFSKTIIFCVDVNHAERMRQALINENSDLVKENHRYIMRITGDNPEGKAQLDYFIDGNEKYPSIVTTSKLMTTGVDAKTTRLIVLDNAINSMTEFKQIIGRGTRLVPEFDKYFFTIMDFRNASRLFADPEFDGDPIEILETDQEESEGRNISDDFTRSEIDIEVEVPTNLNNRKYRVRGVEVSIINERVQYYDAEGKLVTESLKDFSKRNIVQEFQSLDNFIHRWSSAEKKTAIIEELESYGIILEALRKESDKDIDDFDLILHVAFDQKPKTKSERIARVKNTGYLDKYSDVCKEVLHGLLEKYHDGSIQDIEDTRILENDPFNRYGSAKKIASYFGGKRQYLMAVQELQTAIYGTGENKNEH